MDGASEPRGPPNGIHPTFRTADEALLITSYIWKLPFEDLDDVDNSFYYHPRDGDWFANCNAHQVVKRFLKQVCESGGYDVDCRPPFVLGSHLSPFQLDKANENEYKMNEYRRLVNLADNVALQKINSETGRAYVFVRLVKAVTSSCFLNLLTFTAKQAWNSHEHTFRAIVADGPTFQEKELLEWRAKSVDAVAAEADIDGWYLWNGHDFVPAPLYMYNGHEYVLYSSTPSG